MAKKEQKIRILIKGVTSEGEKFRPSDWAQRLSGELCSFRNRRIIYSPMLQPTIRGGYQCVILDPCLKESNPEQYASILNFAKTNNLIISEEDINNDD